MIKYATIFNNKFKKFQSENKQKLTSNLLKNSILMSQLEIIIILSPQCQKDQFLYRHLDKGIFKIEIRFG